ncbi:hypothetical protein [Planktothrix phage Pra-JY27]|nr:hypothetical protein [Planktothrix phage Pag-Yong1]WEV89283.1 RusA family crossover junction endodeoxyribonuclease [Synechococcus phage MinM2]
MRYLGPLSGLPAHELTAAYAQADATDRRDYPEPCFCIGPQPGEVKCPCVLRAEVRAGQDMLRDGVMIQGKRYRLVPG